MKRIIIIFGIIGVLTLTSFLMTSNRLYVSGRIYSNDKKINTNLVGSYIYVKADNKIVAGNYVSKTRHYNISFIPENQTSFDFYVTGKGIDTTFLKSYTKFPSDVFVWDIKFPQ